MKEPEVRMPVQSGDDPNRKGIITEVTDDFFIVQWYDEPDDPRGYPIDDCWGDVVKLRHPATYIGAIRPIEQFAMQLDSRRQHFVFEDPHPLRGDREVFRHRMPMGLIEQGLKVYRDGRDRGLWFAIEDNQSDNMVLVEWEALRRLGIVMGDERDRAATEAMEQE